LLEAGLDWSSASHDIKHEWVMEALADLPNTSRRTARRANGGGIGPWMAKTMGAVNQGIKEGLGMAA